MSDKKKQFLNKIAGKGYYIALILCAAAIGISGYLYYHNGHRPARCRGCDYGLLHGLPVLQPHHPGLAYP